MVAGRASDGDYGGTIWRCQNFLTHWSCHRLQGAPENKRVIHPDKNGEVGRETEKIKGQDSAPAEIGRGKMTLSFPQRRGLLPVSFVG